MADGAGIPVDPQPRKISVAEVLDAVARRFSLSPDLLCGPRRMPDIARPRMLAYLLAFDLCPHLSIVQIARHIGGRDHCTVMHGIRVMRREITATPKWRIVHAMLSLELKRGASVERAA